MTKTITIPFRPIHIALAFFIIFDILVFGIYFAVDDRTIAKHVGLAVYLVFIHGIGGLMSLAAADGINIVTKYLWFGTLYIAGNIPIRFQWKE